MHKIKAFTLAEVTAVLILMGIVIAITVPSAISKAAIKSRQLKVKRAMSIYQQAVENMVVENDIPRNNEYFNDYVSTYNCTVIRQYYKILTTIGDNGCKFISVNDIYWDFETLGADSPIIAFNPDYFNKDTAESEENTTFIMSTKFSNDGAIRVNDLGYEKEHGKTDGAYWHIAKIDCFINNKECQKSDFVENKD